MSSAPHQHTDWPCSPEHLIQAEQQQQQYSPLMEPPAGPEHCTEQVAGEQHDHNVAGNTRQEGEACMQLEDPQRVTQLCAFALEQGAESEAVIVQQVGGLL